MCQSRRLEMLVDGFGKDDEVVHVYSTECAQVAEQIVDLALDVCSGVLNPVGQILIYSWLGLQLIERIGWH